MTTTPTLNASSRIMYEEAQNWGVECTTFGDHETILMKKTGATWYTRGSRTSLQSSVGKTMADNKWLTKKILTHFNLPTARGEKISQASDLLKLEQLKYPIVIKPLAERHGKGVLVGVKNYDQAQTIISSQSGPLLAEEQLNGVEYRAVCVDFKLVAMAFRKPAFVIGDGHHSIEELVAQKNKHPWRGVGHRFNLSLIEVDDVVVEYLKDQNLTPSSIAAANQEVFLRKTANLSTGGEAWDVTAQVCPENRQLLEAIAKACDLNVVGIDIMCQSLTTPITTQPNTGVIEVNASPGLRMHHFPIQGQPINVARHIFTMIFKHYGLDPVPPA